MPILHPYWIEYIKRQSQSNWKSDEEFIKWEGEKKYVTKNGKLIECCKNMSKKIKD